LFKNNLVHAGDFLALHLQGDPANGVPREGFGAEVRVYVSGGKQFTQQLCGGGGGTGVSQNSNELIFGLGANATITKVSVVWPGYVVKDYTGLNVNSRYTLHYDGTVTPVELMLFTGAVLDGEVTLNWRTASETSNAGFEVQKSTDGKTFARIAFIPGNGSTTQEHRYSYTDGLAAKSWYRLKQVDYDGTSEYSQVLVFDAPAAGYALYQNYPNPAAPSTAIDYAVPVETNVTLRVYDMLGREVRTLVNRLVRAGAHQAVWDGASEAGAPLPAGVYMYTMTAGNRTLSKSLHLRR